MKKWELFVLAALAAALLIWALWPKSPGGTVTVSVDGTDVGRYALRTNQAVPIQGTAGFSLTLVIADGRAHVEDATCPDLICQNHAPISQTGEQIICLPGKIILTVDSGEGDGVDATVG